MTTPLTPAQAAARDELLEAADRGLDVLVDGFPAVLLETQGRADAIMQIYAGFDNHFGIGPIQLMLAAAIERLSSIDAAQPNVVVPPEQRLARVDDYIPPFGVHEEPLRTLTVRERAAVKRVAGILDVSPYDASVEDLPDVFAEAASVVAQDAATFVSSVADVAPAVAGHEFIVRHVTNGVGFRWACQCGDRSSTAIRFEFESYVAAQADAQDHALTFAGAYDEPELAESDPGESEPDELDCGERA